MRHWLFALTLIVASLSLTAPARAGDDVSGGATAFVQSVGDSALAVVRNTALSEEQKHKKLEEVFADTVDINWVSRFVLGRYWRTATEAQRARYAKEYKIFLIKHYTSRFATSSTGSFKITGTKPDGEGQFTVSMEIEPPSGEAVLVDYRVHKDAGKWRLFDVIVEGVSMITTQRSEFNSILTQKNLDALINQLASKNAAGA